MKSARRWYGSPLCATKQYCGTDYPLAGRSSPRKGTEIIAVTIGARKHFRAWPSARAAKAKARKQYSQALRNTANTILDADTLLCGSAFCDDDFERIGDKLQALAMRYNGLSVADMNSAEKLTSAALALSVVSLDIELLMRRASQVLPA